MLGRVRHHVVGISLLEVASAERREHLALGAGVSLANQRGQLGQSLGLVVIGR